jgi:hypothetical protein
MFAVDRDLLQPLKNVPGLDARTAALERQFDSERQGLVAGGARCTRRRRKSRRSCRGAPSATASPRSRRWSR